MARVYLSKDIERLLDELDFSHLGERVAIKVHFGEKGCTTFVNPDIVRAVYDKVVSMGKKASLVECNVLYKGDRTFSKTHTKLAKEHGFNFAPIHVLDGERGEAFIEVDGAKLGKGLQDYDSMIVISHFKGHMLAGFGGAIKNIGMGLGSRAGKMYMHCMVSPKINTPKCIGCGACVSACDVHAISLKAGKAVLDQEKCVGCAMCIAACPSHAVSIPWEQSITHKVKHRIVDYACAVSKIIPLEKMLFINVLEKITKDCDCMGYDQKPIMRDVGIVGSTDMVSIDQASFDLVNEHSQGKFDKLNTKDKLSTLEYAQKKGMGKRDYEIIDLS